MSFSYDESSFALEGLDLRIGKGEFVCILGGNGSGKSTFAKHANALLQPDEGEVFVQGYSTFDEDALFSIRSNVGLVFQNPDDQLVASAIENDIAFGPENMGVPTDEIRARVTDALAMVGLQGFEKNETGALSGGQKQRVAIAGVLAMKPQAIIFDEATAMLDPRGRKGMLRLCRELNDRGMAVVLVTHFMDEAAQADRVVVLREGKVALEGTPEEVLCQAELLSELHLDVPFSVQLSLALRRRGVDAPMQTDPDMLKEELCSLRSSI